MADTVQLPIASCDQCPKRKTERHYTGDSFEHVTAWKCSAADGRVITLHDWNDPVPPVPQWCPLRITPGVKAKTEYRHIGFAKYDSDGLLRCCGPDDPDAFRIFKKPADGVPACYVCDGSGKVDGALCHNTQCPARTAGPADVARSLGLNHPGEPACIFCTDCGIDYPVDWERTPSVEAERWPHQPGMQQCCDGYVRLGQKCGRCGALANGAPAAGAGGVGGAEQAWRNGVACIHSVTTHCTYPKCICADGVGGKTE